MAYGTLKCDNITFTNAGVDQTITVSGIVQSISGNITATGTIQGSTIIGTTTVSGTTVTGNAGQFTTLTGQTAGFATLTGTTVTGTTANFVSGVYTTQISGATITGATGNFSGTVTAGVIRGTTTVSGATVTGAVGQFTTLTGGTAGFTTVTGTTVTGTTANFATISGTTITGGHVTTASGTYTGSVTAASFIPTSSTAPTNGLYLSGTNTVGISTGGTGRLFVDASGNIAVVQSPNGGIPTYSKSLTVSALNAAIALRANSNGVYADQGVFFAVDGVNYSQIYNESIGNLIFRNTSSLVERVRIRADGMFEVKGAGVAGSSPAFSVSGSAPGNSVLIDSSGRLGVGTTSPGQLLAIATATNDDGIILTNSSANGGRIRINSTGTGGRQYHINVTANGSGAGGGKFVIRDNTASDAARLTIDSSGNVGIGTASPGVNLDVSTSGNVQIRAKTTDVSGTTIGGLIAEYTGGGGGTASTINVRAGDSYTLVGSSTNTPLLFITNNTERARIDSSGRFGIGTTSPGGRLDLAINTLSSTSDTIQKWTWSGDATNWGLKLNQVNTGTAIDYSFLIRNNSTTDISALYLKSNGNVGIGTTSPGVALDIANGDLRIKRSATNDGAVYFGSTLTNYIFSGNSNNIMAFAVNGSEAARLDPSGRLLVGTSASRSTGIAAQSQVETTGYGGLSLVNNTADAGGVVLTLGKTRSATIGGSAIVLNGDNLGVIYFNGADGSGLSSIAASIAVNVDGTPGANDMPGRLVFSTTADGAASPTEKMRIDSKGFVKFSNTGSYVGIDCYQYRADTNEVNTFIHSTNAAYTNNILQIRATKAGSNDFALAYFASNNGADIEFNLRGDGNAFADGTWTGGGADYAEYFEWSDENPDAEDRRGISVVLDGNNIRPALAGEDPIGVISGNPSVVGDAAWNKWNGKYLRDDYGTYIQEDYEVEDEDGNTVIQQRRKLNPAYDPDQEYIPREQRPEWDCVGLMGKLRMRKGQPTGSRWIKMRDISDSVEEWLVR